ncbi:hypothetical protein [Staphylococcus aureus]|uniref:hypothetical protein n=1 Tax=Staphylococcus aureus TaxID=1280 RepID=UPI0027F16590|nr:hypothetical protein [Staphylococcus aureus]MDQ7134592.1 hypothetical protein [Staphylococcus aureus]
MHSPIIYLIENDSDFAKSMKGQLPREDFPCEEYLFDYIDESDGLVANTLDEKNWHRNHWNEEFIDMYEYHSYFNLKQHEDKCLELEITKENIKNWDKDLLEATTKMEEILEEYCTENDMDPRITSEQIEDIIGNSYGGERFVVYKSCGDELDVYGVLPMKYLIDDVRLRLENEEGSSVTYQLCHNIVGDYHY